MTGTPDGLGSSAKGLGADSRSREPSLASRLGPSGFDRGEGVKPLTSKIEKRLRKLTKDTVIAPGDIIEGDVGL